MAEKIQVLYVDDESTLLELCKMFLERSGDFTVSIATSAPEAIRILGQERFDTIVSDYQMPEMDGIEFLKHLKGTGSTTPFIIFTGKGREEIAVEAFENGADGYLQKGGEPKSQFAELAQKIKQAASRERADTSLRKSEEKYRHLIEHSNEAIVVAQDGMLKLANHRALEFTGYSEQELLSMQFHEFIHPDDRAMVVERYQKRLKGENPPSRYAFRLISKDGITRWVEIGGGAIDWEGRPATLNFLTDITERKQAEDALRESEEKMRSILSSMDDLVLILDENYIFVGSYQPVIANLYVPPEQFIGKSIRDVFPKELSEQIQKAIADVKITGATQQVEYSLPMHGKPVWYNTKISPRYSLNGTFAGVTCVARDVTERKQSEAVLLEREEKFREIFNKANDAIHLHEVGEDGSPGKFIDVNDVACQMVQYSRDEMLQHGPLDFATQYHSRPADTIFKELGTIGHATFETGHKRKDGIIVPVEVNAHKITLQGRTVVLSVVRDITKRKESEETQLILTEFQKGVITNARVWMSVLDQRGNILMWNTAAEEISGYRAEEVTGKNGIWKLLYPQKEYRKQITDTINRIIHDQKYLENFETTIRSKQGNEKIISWNTKGIPDATGKISDYIAIGVDVTDRHLAEKMLRESEERYRTVIENASEAIVVVQDGLLKYVNPKTVEILQTTHEKVIGKSFPDFVHPDDRALIFERYQRRVEGKNVPTNYDFRIVGENGRLIWVILSAVQILWEGRPATLNFLIEITERKQIEAALQKSEEKFRTVLENVPDLILVHRIGTILYINPSATEVMGYTRDELINKQMTDFIVPEYHPFVAQSISRRMNGNPVEPYEIEILTKSGKRRTVVVGGSLIEFAGAPASLNVLTDITERKQAEDALRQANKQLNLLSSITRHDILNQLMALKGYIELSRDYLDDKKTLGDFLEKEEKSARTIEDQITFTKNYQELGAAAPEWQSVNASIKKAVAGLPMRAVHVKPDPADPEVYADPLFEKVFYNLIDNALRYGGDQMKTIRVSSQESDASLTIICEDDGVGITAEDKKRLFTRGFGKNTGLGLFLSREILAITGITITENGTPGKGARFEITVPKGMWRMNGAKK